MAQATPKISAIKFFTRIIEFAPGDADRWYAHGYVVGLYGYGTAPSNFNNKSFAMGYEDGKGDRERDT